jgi:hypothetical protein
MVPDCLQAVCQPTRICRDPSTRLFATQNMVISVNVFFRQFAASDGVISSVHIWTKLPIGVQLTLPARFWVNPYYALQWVNPYTTHPWVNLYAACPRMIWYCAVDLYGTRLWVTVHAAHQRKNLYGACPPLNLYDVYPNMYAARLPVCPNLYVAHLRVNLNCTLKWENQCASCQWQIQNATFQWVNNKLILPACFEVYNLPQFEESHVSVWKDSTAQYNVADHPFFVFHPMPVDCSSFGETFKMYAHQYRFVCVIELVL